MVLGPGRVLTGKPSPQEAALAAEYLGPKVVFACHDLNAQQPEVPEFLARVARHDSTG